jgi:Flp pilus assembly protein TadD
VRAVITFLFLVDFQRAPNSTSAAKTPPTALRAEQIREAAAAYEQILTNGAVSPALYFNLGNAHFKAGQLGRAIAAYRQAERLTPRDPDVRANLQFARNRVQGPTLGHGRTTLARHS